MLQNKQQKRVYQLIKNIVLKWRHIRCCQKLCAIGSKHLINQWYLWLTPRFSRSANTITLYRSGRCILTHNGRLQFVLISFFAIQIDFRQSMTVVAIVSKGTNDALFQEWVKSYQVKYLSGQTWVYVNHGSNNVSRTVLLMSFRHSFRTCISYLGTGQV